MNQAHNMDIDPDATDETLDPSEMSLDDLMADLHAEFGTAKKAKKAKVVAPSYAGPAIEVQWFPHATILLIEQQECSCGSLTEHTIGMFSEDITRNGATKQTRVTSIPESHARLPRELRMEYTDISVCPRCFDEK